MPAGSPVEPKHWAVRAARNSPERAQVPGKHVLDVDNLADGGRPHSIRCAASNVGRWRRVLEQIPKRGHRPLRSRQVASRRFKWTAMSALRV
jgi:hypothetical protein